ncbi:unnamed protein product, partial [Polarella glacialis]
LPAGETSCKQEACLTDEQQEDPEARCRSIAWGAAVSATAYGVVLAAAQGDTQAAEDVVDLMHSACTSSIAVAGVIALEPNAEHTFALPSRLARADGVVVRMFCHSLGYFLADVGLIAVGGFLGRWPNLWQGRLAHHTIQACANLPCIFKVDRPKEKLALRSVLCIAYFAEFSTIFLRLSNLLRRRQVALSLRQAINWALLVSFGVSRLVNFGGAIGMCWQARHLIEPRIFRLISCIQGAGYVLNLAWFLKIAQIVRKPMSAVPSIEC